MKQVMLISIIILISFFPNNGKTQVVTSKDSNFAPGSTVIEPNNPVYDATKGLTDQEYMMEKNFIHQGYHQRAYNEACKKDGKLCTGGTLDHKFLGVDTGMIQALSKAYALVIGAMDSKLKTNIKNKNGVKKEYDDYCRFIAIGTETIGTAVQVLEQNHINDMPADQRTVQKDMLYKAALSHKTRSKTAKIQAIGWGSTTACYAFMLTKGVSIKSVALKLAGSGLLASFYTNETDKYKTAYHDVKGIADALPSKGACDPISERACYCAQAETRSDTKYCMPEIYQKAKLEHQYIATCIDDKLQSDPNCNCERTNTCFDNKFKMLTDDLKLASAYNGKIFNPFSALARGNLQKASVDSNGNPRNAGAASKNLLKQIARKFPLKNTSLNDKQNNESLALQKMGIPSSLANKFASVNPPSNSNKYASRFSKFASNRPNKKNSSYQYKQISKRRTATNKKNGYDFLNKFGNKKKKSNKHGKQLYFSKKAENAAQINRSKSGNLWKIISHRYQLTKKALLGL